MSTGPCRVCVTDALTRSVHSICLGKYSWFGGLRHYLRLHPLRHHANRRYEHYSGALRSKGLRVVPVEGDGNCLFRSVSHQVYGDDRHHRLVRACCMDYMEVREYEDGRRAIALDKSRRGRECDELPKR